MVDLTQSTEVAIASLVRDARFQIRRRVDPDMVARYASVLSSGKTMPPIKVATVKGAAILVDGFHRVAALEKIGEARTQAIIVPVASVQEARWLAAEANLTHGMPLKSSELRAVFRAYIKAGNHRTRGRLRSYRDIALALGGLKQHTTIRLWMKKDFPKLASQMSGGDDFKGIGGPREIKVPGFYRVARAGLEQLLAAAHGTTPVERGKLIKDIGEALEKIKSGGTWEPAGRDDF